MDFRDCACSIIDIVYIAANPVLKDGNSFIIINEILIRISFEPNARYGWNLKMTQTQLKTIKKSKELTKLVF